MAKEFPNSEFMAIDLIESYEGVLSLAPPNLTFSMADVRKLPFPDNTFDYVFQGLAMGSFRIHEWPGVIDELVRVTKPGGWVELCKFVSHYALCSILCIFNTLNAEITFLVTKVETEKAPKNTGPIVYEFCEKCKR